MFSSRSDGETIVEQFVFSLYTVSDSRRPQKTSRGMQIVPDYTFDDAPPPTIVVIPAQSGRSTKMLDWIRKMTLAKAMWSCRYVRVLMFSGDAGLLKGKPATTHHLYYDEFHKAFPDVLLEKNRRFVQSDPIILTAGGFRSGIDLALHIIQLYVGPVRAEQTAKLLEYEGLGVERERRDAERGIASVDVPLACHFSVCTTPGIWHSANRHALIELRVKLNTVALLPSYGLFQKPRTSFTA